MLKRICKIGCIVLVVGLLGTYAWSATSSAGATDQVVIAKGGNGPGDGTGNGGTGPGDGTGNGPGPDNGDGNGGTGDNGGNGPGDGTGNDGEGPEDGSGYGPGDCA